VLQNFQDTALSVSAVYFKNNSGQERALLIFFYSSMEM